MSKEISVETVSERAKQLAREAHCRYCDGDGYKCQWDIEQLAWEYEGVLSLLEICQEIASDKRCDLVTSERRAKLYAAIIKAKREL